MKPATNTAERSVANIRALLIDVINKAKSGHPGMALDAAPILYALYHDHLVADPGHPDYFNRDRFILSAGHTSALLYSVLHTAGYALSMDDLKSFRQLGSKTPGHPEVGVTPGVDATSGPLGQGIAQAVGVALAENMVRSSYPEGEKLCNHHTYCLCGDGCLMEGVAQEAISLAGRLRLNKLVLIYDANLATLDGPTSDSFDENVKLRFLACNWNVLEVEDGNDIKAVSKAIGKAKGSKDYPTLIIVHTKIGYGTVKEGDHSCHGAPLGKEDGDKAKSFYGIDAPEFTVEPEVYSDFSASFGKRGVEAYEAYEAGLKEYEQAHPEAYATFQASLKKDAAGLVPESLPLEGAKSTRVVSGEILKILHQSIPYLAGGSADVAGSTMTNIPGEHPYDEYHRTSRDLHFGIREFAMAAAVNGMNLHGGILPYCAAFLVFADYLKPALRMASLEKNPSLFIFTHDSIAVGEDGPTHQPIDQLPMLRSIPGLRVYRPADVKETLGAYKSALAYHSGPSALILSRQNLPQLEATSIEGVEQGIYQVYGDKKAKLAILATGSEVSLAIEAAKLMKTPVAVYSLPCLELIQDIDKAVTLPYEKRVSLEMGSTFGWGDYAKYHIGIDTFGASGKDKDVMAHFGFTPEAVARRLEAIL
ncbi:MAG: transketolase [Bacilli bacterium]|nr:transketolase [Bacilli bacterium]